MSMAVHIQRSNQYWVLKLKRLPWVQYGIKTRFWQFRATVLAMAGVGDFFGHLEWWRLAQPGTSEPSRIPEHVGGRLSPSAAGIFITCLHTALDGGWHG
jgi:hypothetical protein